MRFSALFRNKHRAPDFKPVIWNVGIDIPNGIRNIHEYVNRVARDQRHPDMIAFHAHSEDTISMCHQFVNDLCVYDTQMQYRWLPIDITIDISNVYVGAADMLAKFQLHFSLKREALNIKQDAWFDQE